MLTRAGAILEGPTSPVARAAGCKPLSAEQRRGVAAQPPAAPPLLPPGPLTQSATAGLALTTGNKHTSTLNLGYDMVYDPKARNLVRFAGLFFRGKTNGELTADRLALDGRDEVKLREHLFAFGQVQYLRDQFKDM